MNTPELTKKEYIAAMCLQGLLSNPRFYEIASKTLGPEDIMDFYTTISIEHAEDLIKRLDEIAENEKQEAIQKSEGIIKSMKS